MRSRSRSSFGPLSVAPPMRPPRGLGLGLLAAASCLSGLALHFASASLGPWAHALVLAAPLALVFWQFGVRVGVLVGVLLAGLGSYASVVAGATPVAAATAHLAVLVGLGLWARLRDLRLASDHQWIETARAKRLLHQRRVQADALLSALPDTTFRIDAHGRLLAASGGRTLPNLVPRAVEDLVPAAAAEELRGAVAHVLATGQPRDLEYQREIGDRVTDYEVRLAAAGAGEVVGILRDVTKRKHLERDLISAREAALETARLKTKFLANMSHEIRTPMNGVIGMTNLLRETDLTREQGEYVEIIYKSGHLLLGIIDDILDFAKIEAGKLELDQVEFDLRACVYESIEGVAVQAAAKDLDLGAIVHAGVPRRVAGDPTRLRQVLANLLSNAVRFTDTGDVRVHVEQAAPSGAVPHLRFRVQDTGLGLGPEVRRRLFQPILLGEKEGESEARRGTGLGLAICHELVQLMDGEIGAESAPGEGACFWFTAKLGVTDEPSAVEGIPAPDPRGTRVLVVQQGLSRGLVVEQLAAFGAVPTAVLAAEAVTRLLAAERAGQPFAAVLVNTPRDLKAALAVVRSIRAEARLREVPLMAVDSPEADPSSATRDELGRAVGRLLGWPARHDDLLGALTAALGRAHEEPRRRSHSTDLPVVEVLALGARVLVAEDNAVNLRVAERTLRLLGCEMTPAHDGEEAVELALAGDFDLVLMDCQMPRLDGYEATRALRSRQGSRHIPVVAMTASNLKAERERCRAAGMDDFLCKPVSLAELRAVIERWSGAGRTSVSPGAPQSELEVPVGDAIEAEVLRNLEQIGGNDPEFVVEMIELFLDQSPRHLTAMHTALSVSDLGAVQKTAHTMKSSAGYLGALRMGELCKVVEAQARQQDAQAVVRGVEALHAEFERVQKALQVERARLGAPPVG